MEEGKIIRIEDPKLIPTILKLNDVRLDKQVLEPVQCTKAEWIQWLISILTKKDFAGIWALVIDNNIHRYIVALNAVAPPISRSVMLMYQNFFAHPKGPEAFEKVKEWAMFLGAKRLAAITSYPRVMSRFGFIKEKGCSVYLPL